MAKRRVTRGKRADPLEVAMEEALQPGDFIGYNRSWSFVSQLEEVEKRIAGLVQNDPSRAGELYETFLAGCYEKAEEIDDSSGNFGMFVDALFCGWVKARQKAKTDPQETVERLLAWMDDDPYGFAYQLERDVSKMLQKRELNALAENIRARFESASTGKDKGKKAENETCAHRRWGEALKTIHAAQRNIKAYVAVCEQTEILPVDCEVIAEILRARGKYEEALTWIERGLEIEMSSPWGRGSSYKLADMKRSILKKLGRGEEALESAWQEFEKHPGKYSYEELMNYVPKAKTSAWHRKAMDVSVKADLSSAIELFLENKETERLLERLRTAADEDLESLSHYVAEPVARKIQKNHPDVAARIHRAMGMRILKAKKSKYYDAALSNFEQAKRCYEKAGLVPSWQEIVEAIREEHHRKYSFMPGFDRMVAGRGPSTEPSFLNRAKKRWKKR